MIYQDMPPIDRSEAEQIFARGTSEEIRVALIRLSFHDPDWRWVQAKCLEFLSSSDQWIQRVAATCLGHLARIHRTLDLELVEPALLALSHDEFLAGSVEDALSDIAQYVKRGKK